MRVRSLEGRAEEVLNGGVTVHLLQFAVVTADPDVREFQVLQEGDALRLRWPYETAPLTPRIACAGALRTS